MPASRGYEEIPHTADWALRVWAEDLPALFAEAARGMSALSGLRLEPAPRETKLVELEALDDESLLVSFLSELLYIQEEQRLAFDVFHISIHGSRLKAEIQGAPIASLDKAIKAVTFHNLQITCTDSGCQAALVFDV